MTGYRPGHSVPGITWTVLTAAVMFALAAGKVRTGRALDNPVLMTEGRVTLVDGILAVAVLAGLALNAAVGWWWADPLAALVIVFYALREAREVFPGRPLTAARLRAGSAGRTGRRRLRQAPRAVRKSCRTAGAVRSPACRVRAVGQGGVSQQLNEPGDLRDIVVMVGVAGTSAPGFTLTDQGGHPMSLAGLRGRVVVLDFMDPHCTDICPIVSREFLDAYRDLGATAPRVVFLAVNVNRYHLQVADVAAFSGEQQLTQIPEWHFLTGSYPSLRAVWQAYLIEVDAPSPDADVIHSSQMYFIDRQGRERFLADPMVDHTASGSSYLPAGQLASWGQGIALVARQLAA